jgi:hypothetical protein
MTNITIINIYEVGGMRKCQQRSMEAIYTHVMQDIPRPEKIAPLARTHEFEKGGIFL